MKDVLIKNSKIIDEDSPFHLQNLDILISGGKIKEIGKNLPHNDNTTVVESKNLHVSIGWLDLRVNLKDPGFEEHEDLKTLEKAALAGGFTEILGMPNTHPIVESKESISYFTQFNQSSPLTIYNSASISKKTEGLEFTEMMDLYHAGAKAFTDGSKTLSNSDLFLKGLLYLSNFNGLLINKAEDPILSLYGQMHEGYISTTMGLRGIPEASEELSIQRDLKLLEYAQIESEFPVLHFSCISSKAGIELIKKAKKQNLPISCDITAHQIAFLDLDLQEFDTNFKVNPPFRDKKNRDSLLKSLDDGTIDCIVSDHNAWNEECKKLEFDDAEFGVVGLETAFSSLNTYTNLSIERQIELISRNPRKILKLKSPFINKGEQANLTLFDPTIEFKVQESSLKSYCKNSPFLGKTLIGKVIGTVSKNHLHLN